MKKINISSYKKNILKLFTGTGIAQIIPIASAPLLTRLYSPADFGVYATFLAFTALLSIVATFRFEIALLLPKRKNKAIELFVSLCLVSLALSLLILVVIFLWDKIFGINNLYVHWIAVAVFLNAGYKGLYYVSLREKKFSLIASIRIIYALIILAVAIIMPQFYSGPLGLILGPIIAHLGCSTIFALRNVNYLFTKNLNFNLPAIFQEFRQYPLFDLPSALIVQMTSRLPVLLLSNFFSASSIGQYSLTQRMIDLPTAFISTAISDSFKQKAIEDFHSSGDCSSVFKDTRNLLIVLGLVPYVIIQFFAPTLFSFFFGKEWVVAGEYAQILAPMFLIRFIVSPLTYTFYIQDKIKLNMIGQSTRLLLSFLSLLAGIYWSNLKLGLGLFTIANSMFFIAYYFLALKFTKSSSKKLL